MTDVRRVAELDLERELDATLTRQLIELLRECFAEYPDRVYFKVPPHVRFVATDAGALVGHLGAELRMVRVGDEVLRTIGVSDVCVDARFRSRGIAATLLAEATTLARDAGADFLILFADDDRVYTRDGWRRVDNPVTWLKVHEHTTLGLAERVDTGAMMVKGLGDRPWPAGAVDLLGHLF